MALNTAALARWPGWRQLPREARDTLFLVAVIGWTVLPHLGHLPLWCALLTGVVLLWRTRLALANEALPNRWWLVAVLVVATGLTLWTHRTLLGKDAGVTMLVVLMALKTLELRARRDAFVVFFLGFFVVLTQFLYAQSLPVALAMLVAVWGLLTALVLAHMPVGQPALRQAASLAARCALAGAPVMVLLFVFFPRVGPLWGVPADGLLPMPVALGLVLGANLGSGLLALIATASSSATARRVPLGNLLFRMLGITAIIPLMPFIGTWRETLSMPLHTQVVTFHLLFNIALAVVFIGLTPSIARLVERWLREPAAPPTERPNHLDPVALDTPSLAISCAAREALHQADIVETMLRGMLTVIRTGDLALAQQLRALDDAVDQLYGSIKIYLTKISRGALSEREGSRWADIISFVINMEQIADIIERVIQEVEDKAIRRGRRLSDAGMAEVADLHGRLMANLRLAMSVFLDGHVRDAQKLLQEKAIFRDLERDYANAHLARLAENSMQSLETSALHIDLISDLKRINSHICAIAYPILDQAGALAPTRLKQGVRFEESRVRGATQPMPLDD